MRYRGKTTYPTLSLQAKLALWTALAGAGCYRAGLGARCAPKSPSADPANEYAIWPGRSPRIDGARGVTDPPRVHSSAHTTSER